MLLILWKKTKNITQNASNSISKMLGVGRHLFCWQPLYGVHGRCSPSYARRWSYWPRCILFHLSQHPLHTSTWEIARKGQFQSDVYHWWGSCWWKKIKKFYLYIIYIQATTIRLKRWAHFSVRSYKKKKSLNFPIKYSESHISNLSFFSIDFAAHLCMSYESPTIK